MYENIPVDLLKLINKYYFEILKYRNRNKEYFKIINNLEICRTCCVGYEMIEIYVYLNKKCQKRQYCVCKVDNKYQTRRNFHDRKYGNKNNICWLKLIRICNYCSLPFVRNNILKSLCTCPRQQG